MSDERWTLFDGRAGEDTAQVWLEPWAATEPATPSGVTLRTQSRGPGVERHFGNDTIETWLRIGPSALEVLANALIADNPELDPTAPSIEILVAAHRGNSAASSGLRLKLDELGVTYDFHLR